MACILLWSSAVRVHDSQACRKMDVTRERISCILELREIIMSIQTGFNLVSVAVVCAILESISRLEPSSVITEPRYLKLETVLSFGYLSSVITDQGSKPEILSGITQTTAALTRLKPVWNDRSISLNSKRRLMRSFVTSIFLCAFES